MPGRSFDPARHPRDRFGRFTKSRTVKASAKDKAAAKHALDGFAPKPVADRTAYLTGLQPKGSGGAFTDLPALNKALRAGDENSPGVAVADQAMVELPDDVLLSRQVPAAAFGTVDPASLAGMKVRDAGFAPAQLGTVAPAKDAVRMHIAAPAGTRAAVNPKTGEVVLDRDTEMVVARVDTNPAGGHDMYLTVLPKTGAKPKPAEVDKPEGGDLVRADLMKLKVADLQAQMRERGLKPGKKRKSQLVDALVADEVGDGKPAAGKDDTAAPKPDSPATSAPAAAQHQVRTAVADVVRDQGGPSGGYASLAQVRDKLSGLDRADVDAALIQLDRDRVIQLEPEPNRKALTDRAKAAAVQLGGEDMHLVSLVKPADEPTTFESRLGAAAAGADALVAAPLSLVRQDTHSRPGNRVGLTVLQRGALLDYQGADYSLINGRLRDLDEGLPVLDDQKTTNQIKYLDAALAGSPLTHDVVVYRGIRQSRKVFGDRMDQNLTGMEWREAAYVSTSATPGVVESFAGQGDDPVKMRILAPAGVNAVQISGALDDRLYADEAELLIDRGTRMRVVADRGIVVGVRQLDVEVMP